MRSHPTDNRRAAIRRALDERLNRLRAANRLARLRGPDGQLIEAYEVRQRRASVEAVQFLDLLCRWARKRR